MKENNKLLKILGNLDVIVASACLVVLIVLTFAGVIYRRILNAPFTWLEEVQLACMVWIVFAAAGAAFRAGNQVAIEMVVDLMPEKIQKLVDILISVAILLVLGFLFVQSIGYINVFIQSGRSTPMLKIPYALIYGIAPVSYILVTKSVSRFARNIEDCLEIVRMLKAIGVGVMFERENINTLGECDELRLSIFSALAKAESESFERNFGKCICTKYIVRTTG